MTYGNMLHRIHRTWKVDDVVVCDVKHIRRVNRGYKRITSTKLRRVNARLYTIKSTMLTRVVLRAYDVDVPYFVRIYDDQLNNSSITLVCRELL